ncbi:hypothetical protein [Legionella massiliensis]|uniref:hypothetical protein n=1 Tax=Legionella massiliensis TaxID=1034943 RepID=UPI001147889D|nr:hypothetical protein [Legionella massiliensis]
MSKQSRFLLENDNQALVYIAVLAVIPFVGWLSAAIVALITLRKGWYDGLKGMIAGSIALLVLSLMSMSFTAALLATVMAFLPCYLTAAVLHSTASWKIAGGLLVLMALLVIALVHWFAPDFITGQYQYIQAILKEIERESTDSAAVSLLNNQNKLNEVIIANYLVGIQSVSIVLSTLTSLLVARSMQSRLFYPGGFKQEMLAFRASGFGVLLLVWAVIGAYQHYPLAISCLPVLVTYYVFAGLSISFNVLAKDKGLSYLILLVVPLVILPFIMLPIYVILGALDSLFNFRLYFSAKSDEKRE